MTRDELINKVVKDCQYYMSESEAKELANDVINTIFDALKKPTEEMIVQGYNSDDFVLEPSECWQAMLNASPLAKKEKS